MAFTNSTAQSLNSFFGKPSALGSLSSAPSVRVGLSLADPLESGAGVAEPSGAAGYTRISTSPADWNPAGPGPPATISNVSVFTFGPATANWGLVGYVCLFGASGMLGSTPLSPRLVGAGEVVVFAPAGIELRLGG
jgi:hypothetical protein